MTDNQTKMENKLFKSYYGNKPPKRLFYDVTSSYVEGDYQDSDLVNYGYNRDGKKGKKQIVIGLLTDADGHAVSVQVYSGNTHDVKTFSDQLDKIKRRFNLDNITIVGDGGMIKSKDIIKIRELGYDYITSIGKPSINKLIEDNNNGIQLELFDKELTEVIADDTRYILRCNPHRRDEIINNTSAKIARFKRFVAVKSEYYNTHYKAKPETLTKAVDKKLADLKLTQFVKLSIDYKTGSCTAKDKENKYVTKSKELANINIVIDQTARDKAEELDGCYVIKTSLTDVAKNSKEELHKAYKTLIKVENAFKTLKTEFLEIRPLYLKTDSRIKGHIALSMHAYNIVLKLKQQIKEVGLDFKTTITQLASVTTNVNKVNKVVLFESVPGVCGDLSQLFEHMGFKLQTRI